MVGRTMNCPCAGKTACDLLGTTGWGEGFGVGAADLVAADARATDQPRSGEAELRRRSGAAGGGEGRVLVDALAGEEVDFVVDELSPAADDRLAVALGIVGETEVGRELRGRVVGELTGDTGVSVEEGAGGSGGGKRS